MATLDLSNDTVRFDTGLDNVIIENILETYAGGVVLSGLDNAKDVIPAGTPIVKTKEGEFKPFSEKGDELQYVGVTIHTILKKKPAVGIMTRGTVNVSACEDNMRTLIKEFAKENNHIIFKY